MLIKLLFLWFKLPNQVLHLLLQKHIFHVPLILDVKNWKELSEELHCVCFTFLSFVFSANAEAQHMTIVQYIHYNCPLQPMWEWCLPFRTFEKNMHHSKFSIWWGRFCWSSSIFERDFESGTDIWLINVRNSFPCDWHDE